MTKKNQTKRALISSAISLFLCFSMLVGTTFAWFTDSVSSAKNQIVAGNLDIELYYQAEGQTDWTKVGENTNIFKEDTLWEPGHTEVVKFKIVNEGTLALKYQLGVYVAGETPSTNVAGEPFKLSDYIKYGIVDGEQDYTRETAIAAVDATATKLNVAYESGTKTLQPKAENSTAHEAIVTMVVYMPETVGNEANAKKGAATPSIQLGVNLVATQKDAEEDSFGSDYDEDAWHPDMEVATAADLQAALNNGVTNIALADDIVLEEPIVIPAPAASTYSLRRNANAVVINLNGKKITSNLTSGRAILVQGAAEIKNGTITTTNGVGAIFATGKSASLILTDMTVAVTGTGTNKEWILTAVGAANGAKVVINNGTYSAEKGYGLVVSTTGADVTINDGIFTTEGTTESAAVRFDSGWDNSKVYTKAVINGGVFNAPEGGFAFTANNAYGKDITINGGTFNGKVASHYQDNGVVINGGIFNDKLFEGGNHTDKYQIKGGTFSFDPTKRVAEGFKAHKDADGSFIVLPANVDGLIYNADLLAAALANGGEYILTKDIVVAKNETITIANGTSAIIDLNGFKISGTADKTGNQELFLVKGDLTVKNGAMEYSASNNQGWNAMITIFDITAGGSLNIADVKATVSGSDMNFIAHLNNWGTATLNVDNCDFTTTYVGVRAFNSGYDMNTVTIKNTSFHGGRMFWVHNYTSEGKDDTTLTLDIYGNGNTTDNAKPVRFGFSNEIYYTIDGAIIVDNATALDSALANGENVVLSGNMNFNSSETTANSGYGATGVSVKGSVLDGNGYSLGINNWGTWDSAVHTTGGTIKNLTINSGMRGIFMGSATADVYIDHVVIDGTIYTFNSDGGSKDYGVYISNSTLNGWTSHSDVHKEVVYTTCNFGEGNGYAFCRPYGPTTFVNCAFEEGFEVDAIGAVTFENCTIGGVALTADNLDTLVTSGIANATVK